MSSDEDDCVYLGTPLEPIEEDEVVARKAPRIEDQIVCDKQGRRRFHGAFTGGFSAGYYNSVGTKEGFTPSTFVSSRNQEDTTKKTSTQTAKDFMDDEDLEYHGIAPQGIQTSRDYAASDPRKRKRPIIPQGPIPGQPVLEEILRPSRDTVGMKLLRKLGWRTGQGIGPRVGRREKKIRNKDKHRVYGCHGPGEYRDNIKENDTSESDDDCNDDEMMNDYMKDVTFAPDDVTTNYLNKPKSNQFGLGYKPLDRSSVLGGGHLNLFDPSPLSMTEKKKKVLIKGQAFGVGAFEEEDEDIYSREDMSDYDFTLGGDDRRNKGSTRNITRPAQLTDHMSVIGLSKVLEGFRISLESILRPKVYLPPTLPKDFVNKHKPKRRSRFEIKESDIQGLGRHDLSSEQRKRILSDQTTAPVEIRSGLKNQLPQEASFDRLTETQSDRASVDTGEVDKIIEEYKNSNSRLSSDFKPFGKDVDKQKRYDLYLRMKEKGQKDRYHLAQPRSMTEWEKEREVREFGRSASLFKPLASTMASRFVTARKCDVMTNLKDGLNTDIPKAKSTILSDNEDLLDVSNVTEDPRLKAAKMKMYGKLTQYTVDWHPDKLLCRRFNVPPPFPNSSFVGVSKSSSDKASIFNFLSAPLDLTAGLQRSSVKDDVTSIIHHQVDTTQPTTEPEDDETYGLKVPIDGAPTMDLFKAIFQDSDSDSDSDSSDENDSTKNDNDRNSDPSFKHGKPLEINSSSGRLNNGKDNSQEMSNKVKDASTSSSKHKDKHSYSEASSQIKCTNEIGNNSSTDVSGSKSKNRISRFQPIKNSEDIFRPVFLQPKKKIENNQSPESSPKREEPNTNSKISSNDESISTTEGQAKSIFSGIDFVALNSYRNPEKLEKVPLVNCYSDSDDDDTYGPPIPAHIIQSLQLVRGIETEELKSSTIVPPDPQKLKKWIEISKSVKKSKKSPKRKHKHKKEKKKNHKYKKCKKKSKKHKKRSSSSSSSSSADSS